MGAPESNAGDDFHFWWAATRVLALIEPGTDLRLLTLEGLASVDDPDEAYETVDVGEYFGGDRRGDGACPGLVAAEVQHSGSRRRWTAERLCEKRRRRRADGSTGAARSVARDLAEAYRQSPR